MNMRFYVFNSILLIFFSFQIPVNAQVQKGSDLTGLYAGDNFGHSISMPDSNTMAVGAPFNDSLGINRGQVSVFVWNGTTWIQKGNSILGIIDDDRAGISIHMPDPNTIAVGEPYNDIGGTKAGRVRVFAWNGVSWSQKGSPMYGSGQELYAGNSVFMPGPNTVAVGLPGYYTNTGSVKVYYWNGNNWIQKGATINGQHLSDDFGCSLSMPDSNTIAIGADQNSPGGYVKVFSWNGALWQLKGQEINGPPISSWFGKSVSMPDVNTVGIGATNYDSSWAGAGLVRIYNWNGNAWVQRGSDIVGDSTKDGCGYSVSMPDADHIVIGYPQFNVFTRSGKVKAFAWDGTDWVQMGTTILGVTTNEQTGFSVCMPSPNTIAIGAPHNDNIGLDGGLVRVFEVSMYTGQDKINERPSLRIYPNPASTLANILIQDNFVKNISIQDLSGREMKVVHKSEHPIVLDVSKYENGIYLIRLTSDKTSFTEKIIVQHKVGGE